MRDGSRDRMKGKTLTDLPAGLITSDQAIQLLKMTRQEFHQSGLGKCVDRWRIGRAHLYKKADIEALSDWLLIRDGLIALRALIPTHPRVPTADMFALATVEGHFDDICPLCGSYAVTTGPNAPAVWCPKHGVTPC